MALSGIIQSLVILVVVVMYSAVVWKSMDQYFRDEFKKHLAQDANYKNIQKMKQDRVAILKKEQAAASVQDNLNSIKLIEEVGTEKYKQGGCKRENVPANKYKNQDGSDEEYVDDGEVCPFTPPLELIDGVGGG